MRDHQLTIRDYLRHTNLHQISAGDIGEQAFRAMEAILAGDPKPFGSDQPLKKSIDGLLGDLVRMGIAEAHRLEESLRLI